MKMGFIGCGNMAIAMMKGIINNNIIAKNDIIGADLLKTSLDKIQTEMEICITSDNKVAARRTP